MANAICQTVENALKAYIVAQAPTTIATTSIFTGTGWGVNSEEDLDADQERRSNPLPNVVCSCEEATPWVAPGNWEATAIIRVRSNADDTKKATHQARAEEIFGYFFTGQPGEYITLANAISAALANFSCQAAMPGDVQRTIREDRSWVSELPLVLKCCGSDVAAE